MPKILINEIDQTTPGTPSGYSNYSVLLTGFYGEIDATKGEAITADTNGVYEFSSAGDFEATIGLVNEAEKIENGIKVYHYGNKMAYMLLKLGYTVLYKAIDKVVPEDENDTKSFFSIFGSNFWKPFRDKASYDFRFVSHGLLESDASDLSENIAYQKAAAGLAEAENAIKAIDAAITELDKITKEADKFVSTLGQEADKDHEAANFCNNWYLYGEAFARDANANKINEYFKTFAGFENGVNDKGEATYYPTFSEATEGTANAKVIKEAEKAEHADTIQLITKYTLDTTKINEANICIANLAKYYADTDLDIVDVTGRGDCIALIELDENSYKDAGANPENLIIDAIKEVGDAGITKANGKYCAMTVPSVVYGDNLKMPGAFHYLACFMSSLQSGFAEWYAAAGYTRGVASMTIDHTTVALGEIAINALEPRNKGTTSLPFACNVIANFRGSYYLWGNRTAHLLGDANGNDGDLVASHFLNIRHLCTTIKKQLYVACRRFTFDPNSDTLWFNFVNAIRPTLDTMKADQGIRDYKILKVPTTQKATLKAKIRIIPIEAVEDFDLEISLEDSFGETAVTATESI